MKNNYLKQSCRLNQIVTKATHENSVLDLYYTNIKEYYSPPHHEPGIGLSKHRVIICTPTAAGPPPPVTAYVTKRAQGPHQKEKLSRALAAVDWTPLYRTRFPSCKDQFELFTTVIEQLMNNFFPFKEVKVNSNNHAWVTGGFRQLVALSQHHFHAGNTLTFRFFRNKVNHARKHL